MSLATVHFSLGAAIAVILFRIVDYYSKKQIKIISQKVGPYPNCLISARKVLIL